MRYFLLAFVLLCAAVVGVAGFRGGKSRRPPIELFPDMDRQPKLRPQTSSTFFQDGLSAQRAVAGTVARSSPDSTVPHYADVPFNTGREIGTTNFVQLAPVKIDAAVLSRGQDRYGIYCAVCHGGAGDGKGVIGKYGLVAANLQESRFITLADGEMFNTISYGKNLMEGYAANIPIQDRWAIVAYVRALQRSRMGSIEDVPENLRASLKK